MRTLPALPLAGLLALVAAAPAAATDITVTTRADTVANDGRCSLREAVNAANFGVPSGAAAGECPAGGVAIDVILLGGGQHVLSRAGAREGVNATGDLDLLAAGPIRLSGLGRDRTSVSGDGIDRVLDVLAGTVATVEDLAIVGGAAPDGADATGPVAGGDGEGGGGVRNSGFLTLRDGAVRGNRAGRGGAGGDAIGMGFFVGLAGGRGGEGGGIQSTGELTLIRTLVADNRAGAAGPAGDGLVASTQSPAGGDGGGIAATGPLTVTDSTIEANRAGAGGDGGGGTNGSAGSGGGRGGGILATGLTAITGSTISGNATGAGGRGAAGSQFGGAGGGGGSGGGIFATGALTVTGTLLASNGTGNGAQGGDGAQNEGNGGSGGGGGSLVAVNATLESSTLIGGATGAGAAAGSGPPPVFPGITGLGTAIDSFGTITLVRSITSGSCDGGVANGGGNLATAIGCGATIADPLLTAAGVPLAGSPAIDAATSCPAVDVAGTARPQGAACDIGGVEAPATAATAAPGALDFGSHGVGSSATLAVDATNPGLPGLPLALAVGGDPAFTLAGHTCGAVLAGGAGCVVTVRFAPVAAGMRTGTLQIGDGVLARPMVLPLSGTGVAPSPGGSPPPAPQCVVPKLKGKTLKAARAALKTANCKLGKVTRRGRGRPGRIRAFSPKAGSVRPAGAKVRVTVNRRRA